MSIVPNSFSFPASNYSSFDSQNFDSSRYQPVKYSVEEIKIIDERVNTLSNLSTFYSVKDLVYTLVFADMEPTELQIVRTIYSWMIALRNMKCIVFSWEGPEEAEFLRYKDGSIIGYAKIFQQLTSHAGLACEIVHGIHKNWSSHDLHNAHTWNMVLLDSNWHIVDLYCAISLEETINPDGSKNPEVVFLQTDPYFFVPPQEFIFTHYTRHSLWQNYYLEISYPGQVDWTECDFLEKLFREFPQIKREFFRAGLQLTGSSVHGMVVTRSGRVKWSFRSWNKLDFFFEIHQENSGCISEPFDVELVKSIFLCHQKLPDVNIYCALPRPGSYLIKIFTKPLEQLEPYLLAMVVKLTFERDYQQALEDRSSAHSQQFRFPAPFLGLNSAILQQYGLTPREFTEAVIEVPVEDEDAVSGFYRRLAIRFTYSRPEAICLMGELFRWSDSGVVKTVWCAVKQDDSTYCLEVELPDQGVYFLLVSVEVMASNQPAVCCHYLIQYGSASQSQFGECLCPYIGDLSSKLFPHPEQFPSYGCKREGQLVPVASPRKLEDTVSDDLTVSKILYDGNRDDNIQLSAEFTPDFDTDPLRVCDDDNREEKLQIAAELTRDLDVDQVQCSEEPCIERNVPASMPSPHESEGVEVTPPVVTSRKPCTTIKTQIKCCPDLTVDNEVICDLCDTLLSPKSTSRHEIKTTAAAASSSSSMHVDIVITVEHTCQASQDNINATHKPPPPPVEQESVQSVLPSFPVVAEFPKADETDVSKTLHVAAYQSEETESTIRDRGLPTAEEVQSMRAKYQDLIWRLTTSENITCTQDKVKNLFLWLASADLKNLQFSSPVESSPNEMLMQLKEGLITHAHAFERLCRFADIPCRVVSGISKGNSFYPGMRITDQDRPQLRHLWNCVNIDGKWFPIDTLWAARRFIEELTPCSSCDPVDKLQYKLDSFYFLTDPDELKFSHLADNQEDQLLTDPLTLDQFNELPILKSGFFKKKLLLLSHQEAVIRVGENNLRMKFGYLPRLGTDLHFAVTLHRALGPISADCGITTDTWNSRENCQQHVIHYTSGVQSVDVNHNVDLVHQVYMRFPHSGLYLLTVFCKDEDESMFCAAAQFCIAVDLGGQEAGMAFPLCPTNEYGPTELAKSLVILTNLASPNVICRISEMCEIPFWSDVCNELNLWVKLRCDLMKNFNLDRYVLRRVLRDHFCNKNHFIVTVFPPISGEYGLEVYTENKVDSQKKYSLVWQFLLHVEHPHPYGKLPIKANCVIGRTGAFESLELVESSHSDPFIVLDRWRESFDPKLDLDPPVDLIIGLGKTSQLPVYIVAQLYCVNINGNEEMMDHYHMQQNLHSVNQICFELRFPGTGMYRLSIYGQPKEAVESLDSLTNISLIYNYVIKVTCATRLNKDIKASTSPQLHDPIVANKLRLRNLFPKQTNLWRACGGNLIYPLHQKLRIKSGQKLPIALNIPDVAEVVVQYGGQNYSLTKNGDHYMGELQLEPNQCNKLIVAYHRSNEDSQVHYAELLEYNLHFQE